MTDVDCDVAIVGYGPVGQVLAGLLAQDGHRVIVVERYRSLYGLPRAIRFDGEAMRMFQRVGIVDAIRAEIYAADHYAWFGADGELIVDIDESGPHPSGWSRSYTFFQPAIEQALDAAARERFGADVQRGWSCEALRTHEDHVALELRGEQGERRTLRAQYVVGADGANSTVRDTCGIEQVDLGFAERWLVVDVRPHDMARFEHLPVAAQYCDPARPYVTVRNGARHRRWEFMLLPHERPGDFDDPARTWELLAPFIGPEDGTVVRKAVYEFRSLLAETMRAGRVLLAGDAAHLMPPFMAEGMCSGLRDANNLAWRLDLILRGVADDALLDTYTSERRAQNEAMVRVSMEMGRVSCTLDRQAAVARDAAFRAGKIPPPPPFPAIGPGVVQAGARLAGGQAVQGTVERAGRAGRLDDVLGARFVVVCAGGDPRAGLGKERTRFLEEDLRGALISLDPSAPDGVRDLDGVLTAWLAANGAAAVVSRPDAYVFGIVDDLDGLPALVDDLRAQLTTSAAAPAA
jgi:2-polyprenyl-6-methoxyphenol hydroxylase-like FAD-dependent oxidoreductase